MVGLQVSNGEERRGRRGPRTAMQFSALRSSIAIVEIRLVSSKTQACRSNVLHIPTRCPVFVPIVIAHRRRFERALSCLRANFGRFAFGGRRGGEVDSLLIRRVEDYAWQTTDAPSFRPPLPAKSHPQQRKSLPPTWPTPWHPPNPQSAPERLGARWFANKSTGLKNSQVDRTTFLLVSN